jgi:hypothetical protein
MLAALPPVLPGIYPGAGQASLLRANSQQWLFQQQLIIAGQSSIAVQLERIKMSYFYPFGCSLQIFFTNISLAAADPGAFEVDAQTSDIDREDQYCTTTGLTAVSASNFAGRIELPWLWAKFIRVNVKTLTNGVYSNVLVTR